MSAIMLPFLSWLKGTMDTPTPYGWFHIMWLFIVLGGTICLSVFCRDVSEKWFRRILRIAWICFVGLEIYKQFTFSYSVDLEHNTISWHYSLYAFPFQFCSSPFYFLPFIAFNPRKGKVSAFISDAFMAFGATFSLVAGIGVMAYPNTVFISQIGINIQTMVHHGMMVVLGIYLIVYNRKRWNIHLMWKAFPAFGFFATVAMILNEAVYPYAAETGQVFNMFFISRHFTCEIPVYSTIQANSPYLVFLLFYLTTFSLGAFLVFELEHLILWLVSRSKVKKPIVHATETGNH